jgi:hypothetical protein
MSPKSIRLLLSLFSKGRISLKLIHFILVGMRNIAFGYAIFAALYLLTRNYSIDIVLATAVGIVFNFFSTRRLGICLFGRGAVPPVRARLRRHLPDKYLAYRRLWLELLSLPVVLFGYWLNDRIMFRRKP